MVMGPSNSNFKRQLNPLPKSVINLYGLLAVIIVLIPEWIADLGILFFNRGYEDELPAESIAWESSPELKLAKLKILELRQLAKKLRIHGYSGDTREEIYQRLLKRLKQSERH